MINRRDDLLTPGHLNEYNCSYAQLHEQYNRAYALIKLLQSEKSTLINRIEDQKIRKALLKQVGSVRYRMLEALERPRYKEYLHNALYYIKCAWHEFKVTLANKLIKG